MKKLRFPPFLFTEASSEVALATVSKSSPFRILSLIPEIFSKAASVSSGVGEGDNLIRIWLALTSIFDLHGISEYKGNLSCFYKS